MTKLGGVKILCALVFCVACGGDDIDSPTPDAGGSCSGDLARFYAEGCTFTRPDGSTVSQHEVRLKCGDVISAGAAMCMSNTATFGECLGFGGGFGVFCEGAP